MSTSSPPGSPAPPPEPADDYRQLEARLRRSREARSADREARSRVSAAGLTLYAVMFLAGVAFDLAQRTRKAPGDVNVVLLAPFEVALFPTGLAAEIASRFVGDTMHLGQLVAWVPVGYLVYLALLLAFAFNRSRALLGLLAVLFGLTIALTLKGCAGDVELMHHM